MTFGEVEVLRMEIGSKRCVRVVRVYSLSVCVDVEAWSAQV